MSLSGLGMSGMASDIFGSVYGRAKDENPEWSENEKFTFAIVQTLPQVVLENYGVSTILRQGVKIPLSQALKGGSFWRGVMHWWKGCIGRVERNILKVLQVMQ